MERFVEEVAAVRMALGLERVHLYGHSWGGWLAIEYMLTRPAGVASLILASTSASVPEWAREVEGLKTMLPQATQVPRFDGTKPLDASRARSSRRR